MMRPRMPGLVESCVIASAERAKSRREMPMPTSRPRKSGYQTVSPASAVISAVADRRDHDRAKPQGAPTGGDDRADHGADGGERAVEPVALRPGAVGLVGRRREQHRQVHAEGRDERQQDDRPEDRRLAVRVPERLAELPAHPGLAEHRHELAHAHEREGEQRDEVGHGVDARSTSPRFRSCRSGCR